MSIKGGIQGLRKWILDHVPLGNHIVFESYPVYTDNTKAVYEEMVRRASIKSTNLFGSTSTRKRFLPVWSMRNLSNIPVRTG